MTSFQIDIGSLQTYQQQQSQKKNKPGTPKFGDQARKSVSRDKLAHNLKQLN